MPRHERTCPVLCAYIHDGFLCNALYLDSVLLIMLVLSYVIVVIKRVSYQEDSRRRRLSLGKEAFNGIIRVLHKQHRSRKEAEAPVKTDRGLIHTHEIVPVVQFQRESVRQNKEKKEWNPKKCCSDVGKDCKLNRTCEKKGEFNVGLTSLDRQGK